MDIYISVLLQTCMKRNGLVITTKTEMTSRLENLVVPAIQVIYIQVKMMGEKGNPTYCLLSKIQKYKQIF